MLFFSLRFLYKKTDGIWLYLIVLNHPSIARDLGKIFMRSRIQWNAYKHIPPTTIKVYEPFNFIRCRQKCYIVCGHTKMYRIVTDIIRHQMFWKLFPPR